MYGGVNKYTLRNFPTTLFSIKIFPQLTLLSSCPNHTKLSLQNFLPNLVSYRTCANHTTISLHFFSTRTTFTLVFPTKTTAIFMIDSIQSGRCLAGQFKSLKNLVNSYAQESVVPTLREDAIAVLTSTYNSFIPHA